MHDLLKKMPEKPRHRFWMVLFLIACHFFLTAGCQTIKDVIKMHKIKGMEPHPFRWFVNISVARPRAEEGSELIFIVEFDLHSAFPFENSPPNYGVLKSTMEFDWEILPGSSPTAMSNDLPIGYRPRGHVSKSYEFKLWERKGAKMRAAIRVPTVDDLLLEGNENFTLKITNPRISGYDFRVYRLDLEKYVTHTRARQITEIKQGSVEGTIVDNDGMVMFIKPVSAVKTEGNSGLTAFTFKVSRVWMGMTPPPTMYSYTQKVDYKVRGAVVHGANAEDFGGTFPTGQVTFHSGEREKIITVYPKGDTSYEFDDTFWVALKNPPGGTNFFVADKALGKILNDDPAQGTFSITAVPIRDMVASELRGYRSFILRYQRSPGEEADVFVDYELKGRGTYPTDTGDFSGILVDPNSKTALDIREQFINLNAVTRGSVKFSLGKTRAQFWLEVIRDDVIEPDETFEVLLTSGTRGITITPDRVIGTIINDDFPRESARVGVSPVNAEQTEGDNGSKDFTFKVELAKKSVLPVSVDWSVAGSGANPANANDFEGGFFPKGEVVFNPDEVLKNIPVKVSGDTTVEPDETFRITLSNPSKGSKIDTNRASSVGTIVNDDMDNDMGDGKSLVPKPPVSKGIKARLLRVVPISGVNPFEFNSLTNSIRTVRKTGPGGLPHSLVIDSIPSPSAIDSEASTKYTLGVTDSYAHPLTFAWTSSCSGLGSNGSFTDASAQNPTWTAPENITGSAGDCTISVDVDDGSFGLTVSGSFTQSVNTSIIPLTVVGSTSIVDDDAVNTTLIEIRIDVSGTNTISALVDGAGGNNTAIFLRGADVSGNGGTIFDSSGSPFTLISPSTGSTIADGTTNAIVQRTADSVFFKITFNIAGGPDSNTTLNSFSGYNCGSSQSNCP